MKKTKRLWALLLAMVMALGLISTAFAAPTIDSGRKASLSLYKYDITAASEDGAWNTASYVSTGVQDDAVTDKLAQYAIQGVEFTYLRVADIAMNNELVDGQRQVGVLYGFAEGSVKRGYSDCTMRITYAATLTADAKLGDTDNPNEVVLTWKRTNTSYYDTLQDCCHLYTYGVDVLKQFSDGKGDLTNVSFLLHNDTDDVYIIAEQRNGMYYVKGFTDKKADATTLVPNDSGHIIVNGLEDDTYTLTEIATDKGYVLLKDGVEIVIAAAESENACETCGAKLLTASGTVNGEPANMESGNAIVPLMVINTMRPIRSGAEPSLSPKMEDTGIPSS